MSATPREDSRLRLRKRTLIRFVKVVPHFGTDEEVFPLDVSALLFQEILNGITNFALVLIKPRTVEMPGNGLYVRGAESRK